MSKSGKIFLGVLSFLPMLFILIYFISFINIFLKLSRHVSQHDEIRGLFFDNMMWMVLVSILMALVSLALLIYYIIHSLNNKKIDSTERIVWIFVFVFAGLAGFPVYWYMRVWKENSTA
jgi:hypothetical protein